MKRQILKQTDLGVLDLQAMVVVVVKTVYACDRAGESGSSSKKSRVLKREGYACGCGFWIREIVLICNYNQKDKTLPFH
ncbi:hypothetical protein Hanom_Chr09g00801231 [Helianthus anomalus]